jgi:hypothetical protein
VSLASSKTYSQLFPDISENDIKILRRLTVIFPEIPKMASRYDGNFEGLIRLLRGSSIYRKHVITVKAELTEETKLPTWFVSHNEASEMKDINDLFKELSYHFKEVSNFTETANRSYNKIITDAHKHASEIEKLYGNDKIFILRLKSNDLMGLDNVDFNLTESSEYEKLDIFINKGVPAMVPLLEETIDFSELKVEARSSLKKRIRNILMEKQREKYYVKTIIEKDPIFIKHIQLVKAQAVEEIIVLKNVRSE